MHLQYSSLWTSAEMVRASAVICSLAIQLSERSGPGMWFSHVNLPEVSRSPQRSAGCAAC
eukprot:2826809-Amphidinium_carterae.1